MATTQEQLKTIALQRMAEWAYQTLSEKSEGDKWIDDLDVAHKLLQLVKVVDHFETMSIQEIIIYVSWVYSIGGYGETDENAALALLSSNTLTDFLATSSLLVQLDNPSNGDLLRYDSTEEKWIILPIGTNSQVLTVSGGLPIWGASSGLGDMLSAVYDPTSVAGDAFLMSNMVEGTNANILTDAERTAIAGLGALASLSVVTPTELEDTAVTAGSYTNADITVDAQGRITAASNGPLLGALDSLTDVNVPTPSDGQFLKWDNGTSMWIADNVPGGGDLLSTNNLSDVADVATARTNLGLSVLAVTNGFRNVKDYGAIGDGTTHPLSEFYGSLAEAQVDFPLATDLASEIDKEAFKKAVDEASNYDLILFPEGNYLVDTVIIAKPVHIVGNGATITNGGASYCIFYGSGIDDCYINTLRFIGSSATSGNRGVVFNQAKNYVVNTCIFQDFNEEGIECRTTHQSSGTADKVGGQIQSSVFSENGIGIQFANRGEYNNVVNCNFDNNTTALELEGGNNSISGCNISFNTNSIHIINGSNEGKNIFTGNNINHNDRPIFIEDCDTGNDFIGNHIITGTNTNIHLLNSNNVRFIGGQIDVTNFFFENCQNVEFVDVLFNDTDPNTINDNYNATSSNVTWTKCRVKGQSRISSPAGSYDQTALNDLTSRCEEIIRATGTSTITLLDADLVPEKIMRIINIGAGTITIEDGGGTLATNTTQDSVTLVMSDGTNWQVLESTGGGGAGDTRSPSAEIDINAAGDQTIDCAVGQVLYDTLTDNRTIGTINNLSIGQPTIIDCDGGSVDFNATIRAAPGNVFIGDTYLEEGRVLLEARQGGGITFTWIDAPTVQYVTIGYSDKDTVIATGTNLGHWFVPNVDITIRHVIVNLDVVDDVLHEIDINDDGVSIFDTEPTLDIGENTSETAATAYDFVASAANVQVAAGSKITVDVTAAGTTPKGGSVTLIITED